MMGQTASPGHIVVQRQLLLPSLLDSKASISTLTAIWRASGLEGLNKQDDRAITAISDYTLAYKIYYNHTSSAKPPHFAIS
jgi:hypothetical protein